jgi:hypothetical protein
MFGRRADARQVEHLSRTRRIMPYLSPRRNDSLVYFTTEIEVGPALAFLEEQNEHRSDDDRITLFHLYLKAAANAFHERPGVNRFVAGGRLWQRDGVWITYSAKQEMLDGSPVMAIKRRFDRDERLIAMVDALRQDLRSKRRGRLDASDKEVDLVLRAPGFLIRLGLKLIAIANDLGILPKQMIENDPMFASVFVANLGSVGLDAGYHHVWEHGTCSIFAVVGRIHESSAGKRVIEVKYTFDERIEDGLYAAITLEGIRTALESPESLL